MALPIVSYIGILITLLLLHELFAALNNQTLEAVVDTLTSHIVYWTVSCLILVVDNLHDARRRFYLSRCRGAARAEDILLVEACGTIIAHVSARELGVDAVDNETTGGNALVVAFFLI